MESRYPDDGNRYEDENFLKNALLFRPWGGKTPCAGQVQVQNRGGPSIATPRGPSIYLLANATRSEFLAVPQLLRFDHASRDWGERRPALLVKASSLLLKYVVVGVPMRLSVSRPGAGLLWRSASSTRPTRSATSSRQRRSRA